MTRAKQANESSETDPKESKHGEDLYQNAGEGDRSYAIDFKGGQNFGEGQLYEKLELVLRTTIRRCLEDDRFNDSFEYDIAVKKRWKYSSALGYERLNRLFTGDQR